MTPTDTTPAEARIAGSKKWHKVISQHDEGLHLIIKGANHWIRWDRITTVRQEAPV